MGRAVKPGSEDSEERTYSRREALDAVRKYSAFLAGSATVILSADDALARAACSRVGGNGNGPPPGKGPPWCR